MEAGEPVEVEVKVAVRAPAGAEHRGGGWAGRAPAGREAGAESRAREQGRRLPVHGCSPGQKRSGGGRAAPVSRMAAGRPEQIRWRPELGPSGQGQQQGR